MSDSVAVVVPIRTFDDGKVRLAARLDGAARSALLRSMADAVVAAATPWHVVVVTSAPEVRTWAAGRRLDVIDDPGSLDAAATAGLLHARSFRPDRVVVAHADLPLVTSLEPLAGAGAAPVAVVVPCHRGDGTPLLSFPAGVDFGFAYGPGSFARHCTEARRLGLDVVELWDDVRLRHDLDEPSDLEDLGLGA